MSEKTHLKQELVAAKCRNLSDSKQLLFLGEIPLILDRDLTSAKVATNNFFFKLGKCDKFWFHIWLVNNKLKRTNTFPCPFVGQLLGVRLYTVPRRRQLPQSPLH